MTQALPELLSTSTAMHLLTVITNSYFNPHGYLILREAKDNECWREETHYHLGQRQRGMECRRKSRTNVLPKNITCIPSLYDWLLLLISEENQNWSLDKYITAFAWRARDSGKRILASIVDIVAVAERLQTNLWISKMAVTHADHRNKIKQDITVLKKTI